MERYLRQLVNLLQKVDMFVLGGWYKIIKWIGVVDNFKKSLMYLNN